MIADSMYGRCVQRPIETRARFDGRCTQRPYTTEFDLLPSSVSFVCSPVIKTTNDETLLSGDAMHRVSMPAIASVRCVGGVYVEKNLIST
jgi:hypothetical protein